MASGISGRQIRNIHLGATRVDRAAAVLPATGNQTLYTVSGGKIIMLGLVGEVTTVASATATLITFGAVPTTGPVQALNLNTGSAITSAAVGTLVTLTGAFTDAAIIGGAGQILDSQGVVIAPGGIRITTDATNTGQLKYSLWYIPLDDGASVVAV